MILIVIFRIIKTSFRANLNIDLKAGIKLLINSSATLDKYHGPLTSMTEAYGLVLRLLRWISLRSTQEMIITIGRICVSGQRKPMQLIPTCFCTRDTRRERVIPRAIAEYIHNLASLVKGLEVRASISWAQTGYYTTAFATSPYRYTLSNYDFETENMYCEP